MKFFKNNNLETKCNIRDKKSNNEKNFLMRSS